MNSKVELPDYVARDLKHNLNECGDSIDAVYSRMCTSERRKNYITDDTRIWIDGTPVNTSIKRKRTSDIMRAIVTGEYIIVKSEQLSTMDRAVIDYLTKYGSAFLINKALITTKLFNLNKEESFNLILELVDISRGWTKDKYMKSLEKYEENVQKEVDE
ncbi:hypothetical protein [Listeria seeligeri]|uniref:hypothetical protein n=1 Tax=Listeria seeligeri TaxID=1640 RepID=UPI0022EA74EF|nr:hypothetical protein [Listeria seeligeri]